MLSRYKRSYNRGKGSKELDRRGCIEARCLSVLQHKNSLFWHGEILTVLNTEVIPPLRLIILPVFYVKHLACGLTVRNDIAIAFHQISLPLHWIALDRLWRVLWLWCLYLCCIIKTGWRLFQSHVYLSLSYIGTLPLSTISLSPTHRNLLHCDVYTPYSGTAALIKMAPRFLSL